MSKRQRNLDGIYFRVERDGKWCNVCYSDLEPHEREEVARKRAKKSTIEERAAWWRSVADHLADHLYAMGGSLGLSASEMDIDKVHVDTKHDGK